MVVATCRHKALFQVNNNAKPNYCIAGASDAVLYPGSVVPESACSTPTSAGRAMCRCDTAGYRRWKVIITFDRNLVDTPVTVSVPERAGAAQPPALGASNTFQFDPIDVTFTTPQRSTHNPRVHFTACFERHVADTIRSDLRVDVGGTVQTLYYEQIVAGARLLAGAGASELGAPVAPKVATHGNLRSGHVPTAPVLVATMVPVVASAHARGLAGGCADNSWLITVLLSGNPPPDTIVKVGLVETRRTECTVGYAPGTAENTVVEYVPVLALAWWLGAGGEGGCVRTLTCLSFSFCLPRVVPRCSPAQLLCHRRADCEG